MLDNLCASAERMGKPEWRPLLLYVAQLHARSILPPRPPLTHPIEEIGPGYCYAPVFGHWDITHALFDSIPAEPEHARNQFHNILAQQQPDGIMPGLIRLLGKGSKFSKDVTHPPVWPFGVEAYQDAHGQLPFLAECLDAVIRQIGRASCRERV